VEKWKTAKAQFQSCLASLFISLNHILLANEILSRSRPLIQTQFFSNIVVLNTRKEEIIS
jgi:hypothetical protein